MTYLPAHRKVLPSRSIHLQSLLALLLCLGCLGPLGVNMPIGKAAEAQAPLDQDSMNAEEKAQPAAESTQRRLRSHRSA